MKERLMNIGACSAAVLSLVVHVACISGRGLPVSDPVATILAGDKLEIDHQTTEILSSTEPLSRAWVTDSREFPRHLVLRVDRDGRVSQLGVDRIGDYFLCLLQVREGLTTELILSSVGEDTNNCSDEALCDVCNSLSVPFPDSVRTVLVEYWAARGSVDTNIQPAD